MKSDALVVGDLMRMSVQMVDTMKAMESKEDMVLVRVDSIERNADDGTVLLRVANAEQQP